MRKKKFNYTLFIATIALVAPFIPVEIDVLAYSACKPRDNHLYYKTKIKDTKLIHHLSNHILLIGKRPVYG